MRHQNREPAALDQMARGSARQPLTQPRMPISAHDKAIGAHILGEVCKDFSDPAPSAWLALHGRKKPFRQWMPQPNPPCINAG